MGRYLSIPILGLAAALSASVIPQMSAFAAATLGGLTPVLENTRGQVSLALLLVMTWAVHSSLTDSFVWAFVGGIAIDSLSILPLGASSFAFALIVFAVNIVSHQLYQGRIVSILVMTVLSTFFLQLFTWQILVLLGNSYDLSALIRLVLLPTIVYNLAAVLPVYGFVRWMQRRLEGGALNQESGARSSL